MPSRKTNGADTEMLIQLCATAVVTLCAASPRVGLSSTFDEHKKYSKTDIAERHGNPNEDCDDSRCMHSYTPAEHAQNTGGWRAPPADHLAFDSGSARCTIPRVSVKEWMQLAPSADNLDTPVVITGFFDNHMPGGFADICTRTELLKRYGSKNITLASANSHSYDKQTTTFEKYVREMIEPVTLESVAGNTYYLFGDNDYSDWTNFTQHYKKIPFNYKREPFLSFGIGGSASGVPFHTHGAVFAEVIYGRKRWFITGPHERPTFSPDNTSLMWTTHVYPSLRQASAANTDTHTATHPPVHDCTLGAGEALFCGHGFWHATLNIGDTVFVSTFL